MKKQTKIGFMFMFLLAIALFISAEVSALELNPFANSKTFVPEIKADMSDFLKEDFNSKYGVIQLSKTRFWFETDKIAEYSLIENTDQCLINCKSKGKAVLYTDGKLFDDKYFLNKKGIEVNVDSKYYIKVIESYTEDVPVYEEVCSLQKVISNDTLIKRDLIEKNVCNQELTGYEKVEKTKEVWNEYNFEELKAGEYEWKIIGKKNIGQSVDFIPVAKGKSLNEWAWWNSDWGFRREVNLTASVGNFSYLAWIEIDDEMKADLGDIIFANKAGTIEYNFTIQSSNSTHFRVRIFSKGDNQVYMYYGNPLATSTSSASNTHFNPIAYYYLDETSGTTAIDSVGSNTGTANNARIFTGTNDEKIGTNAGNFTQGNDFINVGHNSDLTFTNNFSSSFWMYYSSTQSNFAGLVVKDSGSPKNYGYSIQMKDNDKLRFVISSSGGSNDLLSTNAIPKNQWVHITTILNSTHLTIYTNNIPNGQMARTTNPGTNTASLRIGTEGTGTVFFNGLIDEVGIWNKALTPEQVYQLYTYTAPTYTIGEEEMKEGATITLNSPINNLNSTSSTINFNATITPIEATIKNVTLYLNENEYLDLYDTNETINYFKTLELEDGSYSWNITACFIGESLVENCIQSETRTFEIDTTLPNITVISGNGTQPYYYSGINHTVNFTIEDDNLDSGWWEYNGTNTSITPLVSGDNNSIIFSVEKGIYNLTIYANDTFGNVASKEVEWDYYVFEDAIGFNQKTFTTKEENFYLNFTTPTAILPVVYLEYNGTEYLSTRTGTSTNHQISNTLIPNTIGNISFRWKITWGTNTVYTPYYTQTVQSVSFLNFTSGNCAAGLTNVMNFIFKDESNQTALTNLNIKYNFEYGITGGTGAYSYGSLNAVTKLSLCINTSEAPTYEIGYGEIEYVQTGYTSRRYYLFDRTKLTNVTTNTTLYSLPNGDSTSFLVEIRSPTLQPYVDIYTSLLRWYPDLNEYKIVEMGNTDNKGQTVYKVKIEDVDYRIGIYNKNGSLIYLINPVRMVCLASPCSYTINVPVTTRDYLEETLEFESLIEYSDGVFTLTYNDPSQNTELIRFVVTQFSGIDDNTICEINGTSFTGILTCNVSGYEGTLKAVAYRTASPENPIALKIVEVGETVFQGTFGLFLQFLISITLAFLGIINPMTAIILGLIAMVFGVMVIKTITYPILIAISVLGGIIIYMMRRNT